MANNKKDILRTAVLGCVLLAAVFAASSAEACSVPVYRWALERWAAEPYVLRVPKNVQEIQGANLVVEQQVGDTFALFYPHTAQTEPVISGNAAELDMRALVESPARRELVRRLLDGQSAVWVLVKTGDVAKDEPAAALLREQIALANSTLRLPEMAGDPVLDAPDAPDVSGLRVEFSLLEVDAADEAERALVRMLMSSEPDLVRTPPEPVAFPVFGRGRVLYALLGPGINAKTVMKACAFIVGPCACEIKSENPGFDLLLAADWESGAGGVKLVGSVEAPPLPGTALAAAVPAPEAAVEKAAVARNAAVAALVVVFLVGVATFAMLRRSNRKVTGRTS